MTMGTTEEIKKDMAIKEPSVTDVNIAACPVDHTAPAMAETPNIPIEQLPLPPLIEGGLPFIGRGLEILKHPLNAMLKFQKQNGDVFRFKAAHREYFVLCGSDGCEFAARKGRDNLKSGDLWADIMKAWDAPNVILGLDGPKHTESRASIT